MMTPGGLQILAVLFFSSQSVSAQGQLFRACTDEGIALCDAEGKGCVSFLNGTETCRFCPRGSVRNFVDPESGCIEISSITLDDYIEAFQPLFTDEVGNDTRLSLLRSSATKVAEANDNDFDGIEFSVNKFSAQTEAERTARNGFRPGGEDQLEDFVAQERGVDNPLPTYINWVERGAVTYVKDQGSCGCCWSCAAAGAIEGAAIINSNFTYFQSMSFQQLISCDTRSFGCDGGFTGLALIYSDLNAFGGMVSDPVYPFSDKRGGTTNECKLQDGTLAVTVSKPRAAVKQSSNKSFQERISDMKEGLTQGPVAIAMHAGCDEIYNYNSGILTYDGGCRVTSTSQLDHAILMVGYNDEVDVPYWIIKNSWSSDWGESGYFRVAQNLSPPYGLFGVVSQGMLVLEATNTTAAVPEAPPNEWELWQKILVAVAVGVALGIVLILLKKFIQRLLQKRNSAKDIHSSAEVSAAKGESAVEANSCEPEFKGEDNT